jgi:hypothetical protein
MKVSPYSRVCMEDGKEVGMEGCKGLVLGIRSGFYPWGSVGFVKRSAQRVRNMRN